MLAVDRTEHVVVAGTVRWDEERRDRLCDAGLDRVVGLFESYS